MVAKILKKSPDKLGKVTQEYVLHSLTIDHKCIFGGLIEK